MNYSQELLEEIALVLQNEGEFYKGYLDRNKAARSYHRRDFINHFIGRLRRTESWPQSDTEDREWLRRYFDELWGLLPPTDIKTDDLCTRRSFSPNPSPPALLAEITQHQQRAAAHFQRVDDALKEATMPQPMNPTAIEVKTQTLVNGVKIDDYTDSQVYELIASQEAQIKTLEAIESKPKKLVAEIAKRKAGIAALVAHLDKTEA
jgi:hypothetical protein